METALHQRIDDFVASTREVLFVREADGVLMIRPDKTLGLNESAATILRALYRPGSEGAARELPRLAKSFRIPVERLESDASDLMGAVRALLNEDYSPRPGLRFDVFDPGTVRYPTLAEIALTYGCQNRCLFCYASSPHREKSQRTMSTEEVKRVMEIIYRETHVPSLSFTGGEATLRKDLPELIAHGKALGLRINLISNGVRLGDEAYAASLAQAGLDSAQLSLEAAEAGLHDRIVGKPGAFAKTAAAVGHLQRHGVHVHTNTTLNRLNLEHAEALVRFAARELKTSVFSMNLVIPTGEALRDEEEIGVRYDAVAGRLPAILATSKEEGIRFVWYSPIPYCLFNPVLHELGAKSCACVSGILSVDPAGRVLPCSSFEASEGMGSLLEEGYEAIREKEAARYWSERRYVPEACKACPDLDVCAGACPLYWDAAGSFEQIPGAAGRGDREGYARWKAGREASATFGVRPVEEDERRVS
ncbi:MAG: radical SAM protein [Deltaproteobacteria bacterium]|nr:radical SAM protein [Deltaproteobacteria bacterium]